EVIVGQKDVRIIQGSLTDNGKFEVFKRDFKEAVQSKSAVKAGRSVQKTMFSTPLSSFFTLPSNLRNRRTGAQPEKSFYLGYLRLIIALAGICLGGKTIRRWGLAALIFFLLGLGSPIRLGNHLVPGLWSMVKTLVPGTSFLSQPSRFLVVLHIALGVCCAAGLKRLMSSRSRITKYLGVIIIMAVLAETAFTAWYLRFNVHSMQIPECYQYVRSDRENCALMDIYPPETDEKTVQEIMITQIVHNKAVQMPPAIYSPSLAFLPHRLFLGLLIERLANDKAINEIIPLASKKFVALLQGFKIKYVVLHMYLFDKYTGSKLLRILTNDFGSPVDQTGNRYIFRTYNDGSIKKQPLPALIRDGLTLEHLLTLVDQSDSFADLLEKLLKKN
ncbi:MAG: hypothetical protein QGH40_13295, partial [bacterium]|nr:hypothetical protein [bacterium]